jgi:hypothetical protein
MWTPPDGFEIERSGPDIFVAAANVKQALTRLGLQRAEGWESLLRQGQQGAGRGRTATLTLPSGERLRLKQLKRGGGTRHLWRDRFPGKRRLLENLSMPLEAIARGIATPRPVALLLREGPPPLYRGWIAFEEISGATDLIERWSHGPRPTTTELSVAMQLVKRMHDAGLEHTDLNVGNILVRPGLSGEPEAFVIDLDNARLHLNSLSLRSRKRSLQRLERSYLKWCNQYDLDSKSDPPDWWDLYTGDDQRSDQSTHG